MSKLRIVAENFSDGSILTSTPAFATDLENLKALARAKIARTNLIDWNPIYNQELGIQLPSLSTISAVILGRHNFNVGMGIKFILYDAVDFDDTTGVEIYNSGDLLVSSEEAETDRLGWGLFGWGDIGWGQGIVLEEFAPKSNYVHWVQADEIPGDELFETGTEIYLFDSGTTDALIETGGVATVPGYVGIGSVLSMKIFMKLGDGLQADIGRLIVGDYIQPRHNMNYNHKIEWKEDSKQYRTEAATLRSDISLPVRKIDFALDTIDDRDRTDLLESFRYVGLRRDFYINLFPESSSIWKERDYSGIMKLTKEPVMSEYAPSIYKSKYVMEEV